MTTANSATSSNGRYLKEQKGEKAETPRGSGEWTEPVYEYIFRREDVAIEINIGGGTAPETFVFENNRWFAEDNPSHSKPKLAVEETGGKYEWIFRSWYGMNCR